LPDEQTAEIAALIADTTRVNGVVGYSVAILKRGELVYQERGGFSNIELQVPTSSRDRYQIYSATKLFFNVALMQLVDAGRVDPDLSLDNYLTTLPAAWGSITVRQAWSHMTGTSDILKLHGMEENQEDALSRVIDLPLSFQPGVSTEYNQTNFLLLKMVFEAVTGQAYIDYLKTNVLAPAGLQHIPFGDLNLVAPNIVSHYEGDASAELRLKRRNLPFPAYLHTSTGINITLDEFVSWFQMLLDGQFVDTDTLREHWKPVFRSDGTPSYRSNGWERLERNGVMRIGHGGGGRIHLFHFIPDSDRSNTATIVYLDNGGIEVFDHRQLSDRLANVLIPGVISAKK